ncbi:ribonucleotide-diphosphate reductase subunit beta, partial [Akkermansiaceae bacterium]|nr:ribonucleotide-diphosphate reductase subunit beta [Akkermansiaceae bacterium]
MSDTTTISLGDRTFVLDKEKAQMAFDAKKVINGRETMFFNILPLKYQWAYDLYKTMKSNHWEPEDIQMQTDIGQWQGDSITDAERWIIKMGIGYFSAAEGIVGDNIIHVVRELMTAPELKLVLGRHAHEENIHADSLVYMISSLGLNPHDCEAMFEDVPTIKAKNNFVVSNSRGLRRDMDLTKLEDKQALAKNIFLFGQVMEGTQFYGLFGMILSLYRQNKFPGIGQMFRYTLRDESNHIEVFRNLLNALVTENPDIWTPEFKEELRQTMAEGVRLEKDFIKDCLPVGSVGLSVDEFDQYIDHIADRRLVNCHLEPLTG